jgi:hypothetical protein
MTVDRRALTCPSAQPDLSEAIIIGVVQTEGNAVMVEPLPHALPIRPLIDLIPENVRPTEVLRFAAPCAEGQCVHFDGASCRLAKRVVSRLPEVVNRLKRCAIRPTCRWWHQEGPAACHRCPLVITEPYKATSLMQEIAQSSD